MSKDYNKTFCASPFVRMTRSPDGQLRTCVYHPPLKQNYKSIKDAFLGEEMQNIRQEMLDGKYRDECKWCYYYDESNQYSCRSDINERYDLETFIKNPIVKLQELDFAASNKCNFICVTCDESASSGWQKRNKEFRFTNTEITQKLPIKLDEIDELKQITIMGGEPTIDPYNNDSFWDLIEEKTTDDVWFQMVTNCSSFPSQRWIKFLKKLNNVCIGISLDGVGEVGEFCRLGWKEKIWRKNFLKWMNFFSKRSYDKNSRHDGPWINFVLSNFNILNLTETLHYIDKYGMRERVMLTTAFQPDYLCPAFLPNESKEKIRNSEFFDENHKNFVLDVLNQGKESQEKFNKFKRYAKYLNTFVKVPKKCMDII